MRLSFFCLKSIMGIKPLYPVLHRIKAFGCCFRRLDLDKAEKRMYSGEYSFYICCRVGAGKEEYI